MIEKYADGEEEITEVTLTNGYKVKFFAKFKSNQEYITRGKMIEENEKNGWIKNKQKLI